MRILGNGTVKMSFFKRKWVLQ